MILRERAEVFITDGKNIFVGVKKGKIIIPGGTMEQNEIPKQTAIRECIEEIGVKPKNLQLLSDDLIVLDGWGGYTHAKTYSYKGIFDKYDSTKWGDGPEGRFMRANILIEKLEDYYNKIIQTSKDQWVDVAKHNINLLKHIKNKEQNLNKLKRG